PGTASKVIRPSTTQRSRSRPSGSRTPRTCSASLIAGGATGPAASPRQAGRRALAARAHVGGGPRLAAVVGAADRGEHRVRHPAVAGVGEGDRVEGREGEGLLRPGGAAVVAAPQAVGAAGEERGAVDHGQAPQLPVGGGLHGPGGAPVGGGEDGAGCVLAGGGRG